MRIAVIGSANADLVVEVARRPAGGETVLGGDLVTTPGGKGANQAVAAARLGAEVGFFGCVGDDAHGELLRESLARAGVDVDALEAVVGTPTGVAQVMLTPDGENSIVVSPGANRLVTPDYLDRYPSWEESGLVVMQHEVPPATVLHVARRCRELGRRFMLNAAPASEVPREVMAVCDPLVVNESEAVLVAGPGAAGMGPEELAERLVGRGARSVVITIGARGSLGFSPDEGRVRQAATAVPAVVDTTGAGDAFVGAMATALAEGRTLEEAMALGSRVASRVIQRKGAQASFPTRAEL